MFKKIILHTFIVLFIVINAVGLYVGKMCYDIACKLDSSKGVNLYGISKRTFDENEFSGLKREEATTKSKYGYTLSGTYIYNPIPSKNTIILVHGIDGSRWSSAKYVDMFLKKGFNVLIYDSRYHGSTGGEDVTYGYAEKYDLDSWVDWTALKYKDGIIGVHGESLGAATAILHSKLNEGSKKVKFYIADCAYSDLVQLLNIRLKKDYHFDKQYVIKPIIFYTSIITYFKDGFTFYDILPINAVKDATTPILFIHGKNDIFIPPSMSSEMYNAKKGPKELYLAPNSGHAMSYLVNEPDYTNHVWKFIDKYKTYK